MAEVIESGSWCDDSTLQEMWGGLLASSASAIANDTNLFFTDMLKRLTAPEAKFLAAVCERTSKRLTNENEVCVDGFRTTKDDLMKIIQCTDPTMIQPYYTRLAGMGLIHDCHQMILDYQKPTQRVVPNYSPTALGLLLYVRCAGARTSVQEFFNVTEKLPFPKPVA